MTEEELKKLMSTDNPKLREDILRARSKRIAWMTNAMLLPELEGDEDENDTNK